MHEPTIVIIIPALNEELSIGSVVTAARQFSLHVIVVDNGSTDNTATYAQAAGATVITSPTPGYGRACLAGIAASTQDIIVFMDGDGADDPADFPALVNPILNGHADFVIGSRLNGTVEKGALTITQRFGNRLACSLMKIFWKTSYTDLGPFRAIRRTCLDRLHLDSQTYGWTIQMQVRAAKHDMAITEVPVHYRPRIGTSKISGTVKGVLLAGSYILSVIGLEAIRDIISSRSKTPYKDLK